MTTKYIGAAAGVLVTLIGGQVLAQPFQCSPVGEQRLLVCIVNGAATTSATTAAFFGPSKSLDAFYHDSSYGQTWFTGDVVDVAIQMPTACDPPTIARLASEAAAAQGVNLDLYTRRAYIGAFPCAWGGLGALGCGMTTAGGTTYGQIWLRGLGDWDHEMGHSFGLAHAATANPYQELGDPTDVMGGAYREFNGPHRMALGWLPRGSVQEVTTDGMFSVVPLELLPSGLVLLRIPKPDTNEFYYVSYRQPVGEFDSTFYPALVAGVSLHIWKPYDFLVNVTPTRLLDTTPGSADQFLDAPLADGRSFVDAINGITITQLSHSAWSAVVSIRFGVPSPPPPPPPELQVVIMPSSAVLLRGQSVQFVANQAVNWSLSGPGSLSGGLYSAPKGKIKRQTTATVTVTSPSDGTNKAVAVVTLLIS